ncbi:hypothetical protein LIG30_2385 [Burkholderia sp. lig30]|nr:hypothetical protein LIG30_2385 [Burkholderia sp. lig30]
MLLPDTTLTDAAAIAEKIRAVINALAIEHASRPTASRPAARPQKPASGKLMLRIDPDVHARVGIASAVSGESVNQWSEEVLGRAAREVLERAAHA